MPLNRPGETPPFFEYAVKYAVKDAHSNTDESENGTEWEKLEQDFDPNPITIPPYQRKIVWKEDQLEAFLDSKSVLFGTVILATSSGQDEPLILLDGLQRFATATAILHCLYPLVLAPDASRKDVMGHFKRLAGEVSAKQPIIEHNHKSLIEKTTRTGIRKSYVDLYEKVESLITEKLKKPEDFAKTIIKTFINKQIAIDKYYGFKNTGELIQTFININSTGINLKEVDLLRSEILQQAEHKHWPDEDIVDIENRLTEIFQSGKITGAKVLGKHLYDAFVRDPTIVFKRWNELERTDVDELLTFIHNIYVATEEKNDKGKLHPYLYEAFQCGHVPFAITTWFFYKKMQKEDKTPEELGQEFYSESDLRILLRAFYRRVIDGSISRIGSIASGTIQKKEFESADQIAEKLNRPDMGELSNPNNDWIRSGLRKANTERARRIFNACLLPDRDKNGAFCPLRYGNRENEWNIDHLIPKSTKKKNQRGDDEFEQIMNLAPLESKLNKNIKNHPCNKKIGKDGVYREDSSDHPYIKWLIDEHHNAYKDKTEQGKNVLELQEMLVINAKHGVGDARITKIAELLEQKI